MSEFGGIDIGAPQEGVAGASEQLSEEAKQRFAGAAAAMQQIRREEKRSKKRDDQVAKMIVQFLGDERYTHLFVLISRLVARDCPSIFILAILSLIHEGCRTTVQEHLAEIFQKTEKEAMNESLTLTSGALDADTSRAMVEWITRMQMVLSVEPEKILRSLLLDEKNLDGTVLQLTAFTLESFFSENNREAPFEKVQPLAASILQTVFEPFIGKVRKKLLEEAQAAAPKDDE